MAKLLLTAIGAVALYALFVGAMSPHEWIIAAVVAMLMIVRGMRLARVLDQRLAFAAADAGALMRAIGGVPKGVVRTAGAFLQTLRGHVVGRTHRAAFRRGRLHDPGEAARRAVAVISAAMAPDAFPIRQEQDRDEVLIHAVAAPHPSSPERLV